jgi:hypothetical protein
VRQIDTSNWQEQFSKIKKGVVTKSLGWPTQEMDDMFGEKKHIGISHPNSVEGHPTGIPIESYYDLWPKTCSEVYMYIFEKYSGQGQSVYSH